MRFRCATAFLAIAAIALASHLQAAPLVDTDDSALFTEGIDGTQEVSLDEQLLVEEQVENWIAQHGATLAGSGPKVIKVAWHVISSGNNGNIPQSTIDASIAMLNLAFGGGENPPDSWNTGYTFELASVSRTNKKAWFTMLPGSNEERAAKNALATDVIHRLNIYSCRPPTGVTWGTFPWSYSEDDKMVGVVAHIGYLPGGDIPPINTGKVNLWVVGHYLGLYRTSQNGCIAPGDEVDDTPYEAVSTGCCPCPTTNPDTCPSLPGLDPIHNYMAQTRDDCRNQFTEGQGARLDTILPIYRPNLVNAPINPTVPAGDVTFTDRTSELSTTAGVEFLGATPNPFRGTTEIRFAIPESKNVELHIYNAGGQLVTALVNGPMSAGDHTVTFRGQDLSSGIYFAVLRVDGQLITRSVVLSR